jgi:SAM-dependent methyltransferase
MEDFIYDIRWDEDEREWRAQARRELAVSLFRRYRPNSGCANRVLDIGCGTGVLVKEMSVLGDAYGVDTSAKAVAYSRRRGLSSTAVGTADALCFTAGTFDLVTMIEVLEHVNDDRQALGDIHTLLRDDGLLVLTVPACMSLWSHRDEVLHHKRRYTRAELLSRLRASGFRPLYCTYIDLFLFPALWLLVRLAALGGNRKRLKMYSVSTPGPINRLLLAACRVERFVFMRMKLPIGVSLACVAERVS